MDEDKNNKPGTAKRIGSNVIFELNAGVSIDPPAQQPPLRSEAIAKAEGKKHLQTQRGEISTVTPGQGPITGPQAKIIINDADEGQALNSENFFDESILPPPPPPPPPDHPGYDEHPDDPRYNGLGGNQFQPAGNSQPSRHIDEAASYPAPPKKLSDDEKNLWRPKKEEGWIETEEETEEKSNKYKYFMIIAIGGIILLLLGAAWNIFFADKNKGKGKKKAVKAAAASMHNCPDCAPCLASKCDCTKEVNTAVNQKTEKLQNTLVLTEKARDRCKASLKNSGNAGKLLAASQAKVAKLETAVQKAKKAKITAEQKAKAARAKLAKAQKAEAAAAKKIAKLRKQTRQLASRSAPQRRYVAKAKRHRRRRSKKQNFMTFKVLDGSTHEVLETHKVKIISN